MSEEPNALSCQDLHLHTACASYILRAYYVLNGQQLDTSCIRLIALACRDLRVWRNKCVIMSGRASSYCMCILHTSCVLCIERATLWHSLYTFDCISLSRKNCTTEKPNVLTCQDLRVFTLHVHLTYYMRIMYWVGKGLTLAVYIWLH